MVEKEEKNANSRLLVYRKIDTMELSATDFHRLKPSDFYG